ncbi:thrombospondin-1-like [Mercenaria mercenaria]|uniref:thrombospondin-1-like n=1 Tax=Mercenaria mercenaria TaxID=6596 RepID=UPI00234F3D50|nr:thrombospondin-1-like [Mercenaria mercenaria]
MNTVSNICKNTELARRVCQNFCGLCNTGIDSNWSEWSTWSTCDATCGDGTQSRSRMCNSPSASTGASVCNGSRMETRTCNIQACPDSLVCYSCDHGPASSLCWDGNTVQCPSGHACFNQFTTTGMGGSGKHGCTKISNCNDIRYGDYTWHGNSTLSIVGRDIVHNKRSYGYCFQCCYYNKCNNQFCSPVKTPGSWGSWTSWSSCDVTCGSGTQTRHRECNSPPPSDPRLYCAGNNTETRSCQEKLCQEPLKCYACSIGWNVDGCNTISTCQPDEVCFVNLISAGMGISYDLGCTVEEHCGNGSFVNIPHVKIHRWSCCRSSLCNKHNLN